MPDTARCKSGSPAHSCQAGGTRSCGGSESTASGDEKANQATEGCRALLTSTRRGASDIDAHAVRYRSRCRCGWLCDRRGRCGSGGGSTGSACAVLVAPRYPQALRHKCSCITSPHSTILLACYDLDRHRCEGRALSKGVRQVVEEGGARTMGGRAARRQRSATSGGWMQQRRDRF